jgi:hypothetical protein
LKGTRPILLVATAALVGLFAAPASAQYPGIPWSDLLPPLPSPNEPQPGPVANCPKPKPKCITVEIRRLRNAQDRFGCDHRAVFATTYLTLTLALKQSLAEDPALVRDREYLYTEDALFANMYFRTLRAWDATEPVPGAWRIALSAARSGDYFGAQDMLLGINAHV